MKCFERFLPSFVCESTLTTTVLKQHTQKKRHQKTKRNNWYFINEHAAPKTVYKGVQKPQTHKRSVCQPRSGRRGTVDCHRPPVNWLSQGNSWSSQSSFAVSKMHMSLLLFCWKLCMSPQMSYNPPAEKDVCSQLRYHKLQTHSWFPVKKKIPKIWLKASLSSCTCICLLINCVNFGFKSALIKSLPL